MKHPQGRFARLTKGVWEALGAILLALLITALIGARLFRLEIYSEVSQTIRDNLPPQTDTVTVTDYDLLAQEVDAAQMRIPAREDLPEGELDFSVTRGGGLFGSKAESYQITTREDDPKYYVKCSPVAGRRLTPNGEIGGTEVKRETSLNEDTGFCLHAVDFIYGEHLYWVRCESRQGPVEGAPEMLEKIAASILFDQ